MRRARFPREAMLGIWDYLRKYGFVCYYTGMPLDLDDPKNPWYLVFDHWMPRDPRKMVITSTLLNVMKSDLTEEEFWYFIRQLANFRRHGTPVRKEKELIGTARISPGNTEHPHSFFNIIPTFPEQKSGITTLKIVYL